MLHAPYSQQRGTALPSPVHTPAWQEPVPQGVPSGWSGAMHSPESESHTPGPLSQSPG
jgi:hypothetical protein